jgi:hypothetical protein
VLAVQTARFATAGGDEGCEGFGDGVLTSAGIAVDAMKGAGMVIVLLGLA